MVIILLFLSTPALAIQEMGTTVVTATRTSTTAEEVLAPVSVITQEDILKSAATSLRELLSLTAGINLVNNGGKSKTTGLFIRGTNSGHVLFLLNGMQIESATLGLTSFQQIPLEQIERIEIVRGPRSSLYGSEAIGGVIQIFTKQGDEKLSPSFSVGAGTQGSHQISAGLSGLKADTQFNINFGQTATDGFDSLNLPATNPDKDGFTNTSANVFLNHSINDALQVGLSLYHSQSDNDIDSVWAANTSQDYTEDTLQQQWQLFTRYQAMNRWLTELRIGESRDEYNQLLNGASQSEFITREQQMSWQNDISIGHQHLVTAGIDLEKISVSGAGTATYLDRQRSAHGLYAQWQFFTEYFDLLSAIRKDHSGLSENPVTGNIEIGVPVSGGYQINLGYGIAFKAPTMNDLYYQDSWGSIGNPDVEPEKSRSLELSLRSNQLYGQWQVNAFTTHIDNLIQWVEFAPFQYRPENVDKSSIRGLELAGSWVFDVWEIDFNTSLLKTEDDATGNELARRANLVWNLEVKRPVYKADCSLALQRVGQRYDDAANTNQLDSYTLIHLAVNYPLFKQWLLKGQINNLLDESYESPLNYNTAGRSMFISVQYSPD